MPSLKGSETYQKTTCLNYKKKQANLWESRKIDCLLKLHIRNALKNVRKHLTFWQNDFKQSASMKKMLWYLHVTNKNSWCGSIPCKNYKYDPIGEKWLTNSSI